MAAGPVVSKKAEGYSEAPVASKQRLLASRLVRGSQLVVPGTISVAVNGRLLRGLEPAQVRDLVAGKSARATAEHSAVSLDA